MNQTYRASADSKYKEKVRNMQDLTNLDEIKCGKAIIDAQGNVELAIERIFNQPKNQVE